MRARNLDFLYVRVIKLGKKSTQKSALFISIVLILFKRNFYFTTSCDTLDGFCLVLDTKNILINITPKPI